MTPESDVFSATQSLSYSAAAPADVAPLEEDAGPATLFQEINERRARIENAELLRHLRGL
ncbi:MAG TPA: hypothetical protein VHV27_01560 [Phenylobacterium sp.]|jgi:hypothetical protein|nr:hypothetical protein [Phenylobacterium sp.]